MTQNKYIIVFLTVCMVALYCCKEKWDDHYNPNSSSNSDLLQQIKATPDLSTFYNYLIKTGYDKILSSAQFTVWAPSNNALAGMDVAIANDTAKLKQFLGNYLCYHAYYNNTPDSSLRIEMLSGKYITIYKNGQTIENANLIAPYDRPCRNGVLHLIDNLMNIKPTIREYFLTEYANLEQVFFLKTLDKNVIDMTRSTRIGVNAEGNTTYDTVWVNSSPYLTNIANLDDENEVFTYILLTNNAFEQGFNAYRPYTKMQLGQQADSLAAYYTCADLAIRGKYTPANLPDTLLSTNGIKVNIDKQYIISTVDASNGTVILLDKYPVLLKNKIQPIIVEGENPIGRTPAASATVNVNLTQRYNPMASGGYDIVYNKTSGSALTVQLTVNNVLATKYRFYWVAANYTYQANNKILNSSTFNKVDTTITNFNQSLSIYSNNGQTYLFTFPQVLTTPGYTEVLLGEYTFIRFSNTISLKVTGATVSALTYPAPDPATTTTFATPVSLDYIKMVPVIQ